VTLLATAALSPKPVRIAEAQLQPGLLTLLEIGDVRLPRNGRRACGNTIEIVEKPSGRQAKMDEGKRSRVARVEEGADGLGVEVRSEIGKRVSLLHGRIGLAHDSGTRHLAERVKANLGSIAVRVGHADWQQHPIVVCGDRYVPHRITMTHRQQVMVPVWRSVAVVGNARRLSERVDEAVGQEEMIFGVGEFRRSVVRHVGRKERAPRGQPPMLRRLTRREPTHGDQGVA